MRAEAWRTFLIQESGAKQVDRLGIGSESDCFVGIGGPNWKDLWNFISSDSDAGLKVEKSGEAGVGQRGDAMVIRKNWESCEFTFGLGLPRIRDAQLSLIDFQAIKISRAFHLE